MNGRMHRFVDCIPVVVQVIYVHRADNLSNDSVSHRHQHFSGIQGVIAALVRVDDAHSHSAIHRDRHVVFGDDML